MNAQLKKPFNRKLVWGVLFGLGGMVLLGTLFVSFDDPRDVAKAQQEQEAINQVAQQREGSQTAALQQLEAENARLQRELDAQRQSRDDQQKRDFDRLVATPPPGSVDPEMLRMLEEAQKVADRSPELARGGSSGRGSSVLPIVDGSSGGGGADGLIHDHYGTRPTATAPSGGDDDLFSDDAGRPEPGLYETLRPRSPPAERIISQGSSIHAVLMSRIDTRNDGPILAMVTRTVYDSKTLRQPLVPQGSRLIGSYSTGVTPGADRIEVNFNRLILPDGRAFDLPEFPSAGGDGTVGARGKYRSNLLQAIGPSFLVAILGQAIDRRVKKDIPVQDSAVTPGVGGAYQSQSILEQVTPEINREIMQRYQGARPYFIVDPGQRLRVLLTEDVEVPVSVASRGVH